MALDLFSATPASLPLEEVIDRHREGGLLLTTHTRHGDCGALALRDGLGGRSLLTELLRLAVIGRAALSEAAHAPETSLADFTRRASATDEDLLILLEGR